MADILLSPNDPYIRSLMNDPDVLAMAERIEVRDQREMLPFPQRVIIDAWILILGGLMSPARAIVYLLLSIIGAAIIYVMSENWIVAMSVGVLIGFFLGVSYRPNNKR